MLSGSRQLGLALVSAVVLVALSPGTEHQAHRVVAQPAPPYAGPTSIGSALPPRVTARAAVALDGDSGAVLFDKNADRPMPPASLTKILTALVALQTVDLKRPVIAQFSPSELDLGGTSMGLDPGEELTIEDLLYGLMLPSGNDAALVLARSVAGSEASFVAMMNRAAAANGLSATFFVNPHGLDAPGHQTSARDIAEISRLAMRDPRFRRIVAAESWTVRSQWTYTLYNRNPLLKAYRGADGVKTGWTDDAGSTIVASATRNGRRVLVALMNTQDRIGESAALLDWAFTQFRWPGGRLVAAPTGR